MTKATEYNKAAIKQALYALESIDSPITLSEGKEIDKACCMLRDELARQEESAKWMKRWRENQEIQRKIVEENKRKETFMTKAFTLVDCVFAVAYGIALGLLIAAFI